MLRMLCLSVVLALAPLTARAGSGPENGGLAWEEGWNDSVFERAQKENRFVLLDLEAVWCHWCHVMDVTTYRDPKVLELIRARYIPVRVDQDSRPDLSNRYEDYGWPATIVFGADGKEIVKMSGYLPPGRMASLLQAIIEDPSPGPSAAPEAPIEYGNEVRLSAELRKELDARHLARYDHELGSWGTVQKFLQPDRVEYCLLRAAAGDEQAKQMARQTLDAQQKALLDPVWGGVYQYSDGGVWTNPHFEKIMSFQAGNVSVDSMAYALWKEPRDLQAAQSIERYLRTFLTSPDGAFYTSQDADLVQGEHSAEYFALADAERRARGIPRIDKHIYSRENGWAIEALLALYAASGDTRPLDEARKAASWILANRARPDGGFRHDEKDPGLVYLGDTLAMGRAFLALYGATAERQWLPRAEQAADFIAGRFADPRHPGFLTSVPEAGMAGTRLAARPQRDENAALARFANLLFHATGKAAYRTLAEQAMRYLATPEVARDGAEATILLADGELFQDPVHIAVVGRKDDPKAAALFRAALAYPSGYKRVEWLDRREGPLPNADVEYPELPGAAAFVCANQRCSLPIAEPEKIAAKVAALGRRD
jgi:uncharacterized protein